MIDPSSEELAALHALELLEPAERLAFEQRLGREPELRALVNQLRDASTQLAYMAGEAVPPASLRQRILDAVAAVPTTKPSDTGVTAPVDIAQPEATGRGTWWLGWGLAASLAVVSVYEFSQYRLAGRNLEAAGRRLAEANGRLVESQRALEAISTSSRRQIAELQRAADVAELKIVRLAMLNGNSPEAVAIAVWNPLAKEGMLSVDHLPPLKPGEDYQLWVIDAQQADPVSAGVISVGRNGNGSHRFIPAGRIGSAAKFAISREPKGGVPKVSGPIVAAGAL
jgi:anti-sigma-K factor RskA